MGYDALILFLDELILWLASYAADPVFGFRVEDARRLVTNFVAHYKHPPLHSAIGYLTPADKLSGKDKAIFAARDQKLHQARENRKIKRQPQYSHSVPASPHIAI